MQRLRFALAAAITLAACDNFDHDDQKLVAVSVRHENGQPAADIAVELLDEDGRPEGETLTDINGNAVVRVDEDDETMSLRVDRRIAFLDIPALEAVVALPAEQTAARTLTVSFRPVLPAGDTWFQVLSGDEAEFAPAASGETVTLRTAAAPRTFFIASGNDGEGVRHAAVFKFDGGGDAIFTDLVADAYTEYGEKVTVAVAGLTEAPACKHMALPKLRETSAALVYPLSATGFTVYSFSSAKLSLAAGDVMPPNGLACTYTAPAGDCIGKPVTAYIPLLGGDEDVSVDWSTTTLVPVATGEFDVVWARLTNPKASQTYSRDKGGFCMATNDIGDFSYLTADLAVPLGTVSIERYLDPTPGKIDILGGVYPVVQTYDDDDHLHLAADCEDCFEVARVYGEDENGDPVVAHAPMTGGHARIPRGLFARRDVIDVYGYEKAVAYADAVTLPMRGIGIRPGDSNLVPRTARTSFYEWRSER